MSCLINIFIRQQHLSISFTSLANLMIDNQSYEIILKGTLKHSNKEKL